MPIQTVFLVLIALVIPAFFASLFVTSAYHRLVALRRRCSEILKEAREAKATSDAANLVRLGRNYEEAVADYVRARRHFPGSAVATLFGVAPPEPWRPDEAKPDLPAEES